MAKRKKTVKLDAGDGVVSSQTEDSYVADTGDDAGTVSYRIGEISIDMGEKEESFEAAEDEKSFSEYEEIDEKSAVAKKLQKPEDEDTDEEVSLNQDDEFLKDFDFDEEKEIEKYYDS